jgi:hypothetical protein
MRLPGTLIAIAPSLFFARMVPAEKTSSAEFHVFSGEVTTVIRPLASLGYSELDERAVRWFKRWKFRPNRVMEVRMPMVYNFSRR